MFKNTCWANWLFTIMVAVLAFLSVSAGLSGCGNKGGLYLPENASTTQPISRKN